LVAAAAIDGISRAQGDSGMTWRLGPAVREELPAAGPTGFPGHAGSARHPLTNLKSLKTGAYRGDREEVQTTSDLPLLAAGRTRSRYRAKIGEEVAFRPAQDALGRSGKA